jgi:TM2 domain-containing membrane protein YozV
MNSDRLATSYILCAVWFLGLGGLHRLYNGKIGTGLLWLFTFGVFGFGQFVDLFLIPSHVDEYNLKFRARHGLSPNGVPLGQATITETVTRPTSEQIMVKLLKAAQTKGGRLSVTQGVMATGVSFAEVEAVLTQMLKSGYVSINNDPDTGAVIYHFHEL